MGFSTKQIRALQRSIDKRDLRFRTLNGRELTYIEGWHAIAEANRIFGFDKWDRETVESKCVLGRELRGTYVAVYTAKVRVTVRANGESVVREGQGTGEGKGSSPGEAHDTALKAAETDATKRALATFGRPFGLSLYVTPRAAAEAAGETPKAPPPYMRMQRHPRPAWWQPRGRPTNAERLANGEHSSSDHAPITAAVAGDDLASAGQNSTILASDPEHLTASEPDEAELVPSSGSLPSAAVSANGDVTDVQDASAPAGKIDKSVLLLSEPKRRRDKAHLAFVASQPCLVCGRTPSDPHHLRFMQPRAMGLKVSDEFTVPLCRIHHRQLHQVGNEVAWWSDLEIDAQSIASGLWEESRRTVSRKRNADHSLIS